MKKALFFAGLAASLLFVGCNKEADLAGNGRPVGIILSDAATRTVNDGLSTKWVNGDALNVFYAPAGTTEYSANVKFVVDDADANHAAGTADLTASAYDWYLLYPYDSHVTTPASTKSGYLTIGSSASGKQKQAGIDNMAHLAEKNLPVYGVAKNVAADATIEVGMKHLSSVVAVNLTNGTTEPLSVDEVTFTAPEPIVGTYYVDFTGEELALTGSGNSFVSNSAVLTVTDATVAAGASAKFYLAVKPFAAKAGDKLVVKVHAGELVFEKEVVLPSAVAFKNGSLKTPNVTYTGGTEIQPSSLADIAAMDKDTDVLTQEVLVVAKNSKGIMLAQGDVYLQAFANAGVNGAIGDIVTVAGKVGEYAGLKQIVDPVVTVVSSGSEVVLPEPKVLDALDEYASDKIELIRYSGTLNVSGTYYNVIVSGSTRKGSIQYPIDTESLAALNDKVITATGFFTGLSGGDQYVNMMSTSVEEYQGNVFDVTPQQISVAATATSAEINVSGNVDWTAEATEGATLDKTSGNGDGVITVSFPANTDTENPKEYSVYVRTAATGVNDEFTVEITQAKAISSDEPMFVKVTSSADLTDGRYLIVYEDGNVAMTDAVDAVGNGTGITISDKTVAATDETRALAFTITLSDGFIQGPNGKYIGQSGDSNGMVISDTGIKNDISIEASGDADVASGTNHLRYNAAANQLRFRYYKAASYANQKAIQLYKLINDGGVTPPPVVATLSSIAVSGQKTVFNVGDTFAFNGKVTATYSDGSTKDVTASATVSTPDLSTAGTKEVTVTYTEGDVTKEAKYNVTVNAASAHAGTLEDPYTVADAMAATEALGEGKTSSDSYYTKGIISEIVEVSADYGNATYFISDNGTIGTQFKVFRGRFVGNVNFSAADQIQVGDEVVIYGKLTYYKPSNGGASEIEVAQNNYIYSLKRNGTAIHALGASADKKTVSSAASTVAVNVYGDVAWTAAADNGATVSPASGNGIGSFAVSIPANESTTATKTYTITVSASGLEPVTLVVTQDKKDASGAITVVADKDFLAANKDGTIDDVISYTNSSNYGSTTVTELRVYKGQTLTVTAAGGHVMKSIKMTCTAEGTEKQGPGCWGAGAPEGYTFEGKVGTWTGSASSVAFTATDNQVRIIELVVIYE